MTAVRRAAAACAAAVWSVLALAQSFDLEDMKRRSEGGDRIATRALAEAYYAGRDGIEQDFAEAARWYRRLAQQGDARAQTSLGIMYARGLGFERNFPEARRLWQLADIQGDAGARYNLGVMYLQGQGVAADPARAAAYFEKAARSGHVQAQVNLGLLLREGKGVARDAEQAYYWLYVAGVLGDERAAGLAAELERELTAGQAAGVRRQADPLLPRNRR